MEKKDFILASASPYRLALLEQVALCPKLVCPADGIHAEMLEEGNIILAKPSDTMQSQPFRIYKITTPIDGKLEVQARHISYQLNFITVSPFSGTEKSCGFRLPIRCLDGCGFQCNLYAGGSILVS